MSDFGDRLIESAKQALAIVKGEAKPGTYRITEFDEDGKPNVIADLSEEARAEIAADQQQREVKAPAVK